MPKPKRTTKNQPKRLVGYVRVSTDEQATNGVSMDAQRSRLRAHAKAHGYSLVAIESDNGTSGKVPPRKRDGLQRALAMIDGGDADGLVFLKLDRLSRSVRDILQMADEAKRAEWDLLSVSENIDTATATGKMILTVLAALAEMEREQLGERTRMGMDQVAREGRARSRFLPFGYRVSGAAKATTVRAGDTRRLTEHPEEMVILKRMLRLRASGDGAYRIAGALNAKGIVNPRTKKPWATSTVAAILRTAQRRAAVAA